jgi:2-isopropylmalate synthase
MSTRRVFAALLLAGWLVGCGEGGGADGTRLLGSVASLDSLGRYVLSALTAGDLEALELVRLTEAEHNRVAWPELPASRPRVNYPVDLAWANLERRNRRALERTLPRYRGRDLRYRGVRCRGETQAFETFHVLTDCRLAFEDVEGRPWEAQVFKDVLVRAGGHKIFRYYEERPRSTEAPPGRGSGVAPAREGCDTHLATIDHTATGNHEGAHARTATRSGSRPPGQAGVTWLATAPMFGSSGHRRPNRRGDMNEQDLIYDWNVTGATFDWSTVRNLELDDETLRDGLQNPSVVDPPVADKIRLLHLMDELGIHTADVGLPGAGPRAVEAATVLAREIVDAGLSIRPNCAARTVVADVAPVAEISQKVGIPIEVCTFIGSSPIRQYAESWTLERMLQTCEAALTFAVSEGLPVLMVTEDTTRADPEMLKALYGHAIKWGARRLCIADTVGHATPDGARALVRFVIEEIVKPSGEDVGVDWHGHRDRGLGLANALAAVEAGATRVHGTALGIGERCGNTEMDMLLVNLKLLGVHDADLSVLPEYCELTARACQVPLVHNYPVVGHDAFRTATGVHAAAITKAEAKGDAWLADRIYSSIPASMVGRRQLIEIGPMSGISNVKYWLRERGHDPNDEVLCRRIFQAAKTTDHTLTEGEIEALLAAG